MVVSPVIWKLWAKSDRSTGRTHPLICHLVETGETALALWDVGISSGDRDKVAAWLSTDSHSAGQLVSFWASLHDLGKASPAFQAKLPDVVPELEALGIKFPDLTHFETLPHGLVSTWSLRDLLCQRLSYPQPAANQLAQAIGGHHGAWPTAGLLLSQHKAANQGGPEWHQARQDLFDLLLKSFDARQVPSWPVKLEDQNALTTILSGLVSVADWISSFEVYFPFQGEPTTIAACQARASVLAQEAVHKLGWSCWESALPGATFNGKFGFEPNPIQAAVIEAAGEVELPALMILEAPMGIGKTEAALSVVDSWLDHAAGRGFYTAMPTQATSNQMFGRVIRFLENRSPGSFWNIQLIHGQAAWDRIVQQLTRSEAEEELGPAVMEWFAPKKRALLSTCAVGTVDQALLSVLQTRHFFVRLFGLQGKVVIFDEVHAYDTYMNVLFCRLLEWLKAMGASVVLLSATLPRQTRNRLCQAYIGTLPTDGREAAYPRLTLADDNGITVSPLPSPDDRVIDVERIENNPANIAEHLREALAEGGCAAVICNTVRRAQEVFFALRNARLVPDDDCLLFHARTPFAWRKETEDLVLGRFGKNGLRPRKSILVATQVVEQSLDLDFDILLTEYAPIDLVLQRAGRLHRHDRERPAPLKTPRLVLLEPPSSQDHLPDFGRSAYVYDEYTLLRSYLALQNRSQVAIPADLETLVEQVYSETSEEGLNTQWRDRLIGCRAKLDADQRQQEAQARRRLILPPGDEDYLLNPSQGLEEDDPEVNRAFQALTRLSRPSISLVCLFRNERGGLVLEPPGEEIDPDHVTDPRVVAALLQHTVEVSNPQLVRHFSPLPCPRAWEKVPGLRHNRLVVFDQGGRFPVEGTKLLMRLGRELGLEIVKEVE